MAKIDKALYLPQLLGGVERIYAIILGFTFITVLFFGGLWSQVIGCSLIVIVWSIMAYANKIDYILFKVLIRHLRTSNAYIAHSKAQRFYYRITFTPWKK